MARASRPVPRHHPRVVRLQFNGPNASEDGDHVKTVLLVGKGLTYDTGGADIKTDGHMAGMSRDKCGAASLAGTLY